MYNLMDVKMSELFSMPTTINKKIKGSWNMPLPQGFNTGRPENGTLSLKQIEKLGDGS
jgi:hypothetical protein